jgi:hypothetical protein
MPTPTYTPLANITLGSAAFGVTFASIPATYRDLVIVVSGLGNTGNVKPVIRLNGDSASNYSYQYIEGNGASATSASATATWMPDLGATIGTTTNPIIGNIQLFDYSQTNKHKTLLQRSNASATGTNAAVGRWANTAAVTSVFVFTPGVSSWAAGSTFALYGIVA